MEAIWLEINKTPLPANYLMRPGQPFVLKIRVGWISGTSFLITIYDSAGTVVFGPLVANPQLFESEYEFNLIAPSVVGSYELTVTERVRFLPDDTLALIFGVSPNAPPPPEEPGGGFGDILGNVKWIAIAGATVAGIAMIAPAVMPVSRQVGVRLAQRIKAKNE